MSDLREFAAKITREIMTMEGPQPVIVERIALMKKKADGSEINMGGRCADSVTDIIERNLVDAFSPQPRRRKP